MSEKSCIRRRKYDVAKRCIDVITAGLGLALLSPVMIGAVIAIRRSMGPPVLFRHVRPGLNGLPFTVYKFRTMREAVGPDSNPLPDEQRITRIGAILRSTSLDELPQLWNVLKGEMSLVGPRPLRMEYLVLYSPEQARRHEVRPGISGWAQVNGRNNLTWQERFKQDVWYVDHRSFWLDLKILFLTVKKVFLREGISQEGQATVIDFSGNQV